MRGSVAKSIRQYVRLRYPFVTPEVLYLQRPDGVIKLSGQCQRGIVSRLKDAYKKKKRGVRL